MPPDDVPRVGPRLPPTLWELPASPGRSLDPIELIKGVADHACGLLRGDAALVYLWDDAAQLLRPVYSSDQHQPIEEQPVHYGEGAAGQAIKRRESVVVDNYEDWDHAVPWLLGRGLR